MSEDGAPGAGERAARKAKHRSTVYGPVWSSGMVSELKETSIAKQVKQNRRKRRALARLLRKSRK